MKNKYIKKSGIYCGTLLETTDDLNTITFGTYYSLNYSTPLNSPTGIYNYIVFVSIFGDYKLQILLCFNNSTIYYRFYSSGISWRSWNKINSTAVNF